jgi:hypothetical protein
MRTATPSSPPSASPAAFGLATYGLLGLGLLQLALWLVFCLQDFYAGSRTILLAVHVGRTFSAAHPHLYTLLPSPAGYYGTGMQGTLSYHATALSDYLLFFRFGDLTSIDALFLGGLGVYLHRTVRRLPVGRAFAAAASQMLSHLAQATGIMYMLRIGLAVVANQVFKAKANGLFSLATEHYSPFYVVMGLLLGLCAFLLRWEHAQQESGLAG